MAFFLCFALNHGNRQNSILIPSVALRAHTIPTPDTVVQHLQYDVLDAIITHDLFVTTLPASINKVPEL